ncbi:hypothetical protein RB195_005488 [Necator americanus]|uniref:G-protein coupled receptors family 1 profile domain-containing protein n=1 Tax=Necator americanus TaxID=51031 RepID=A0ABR1BPZ4_NECAM
MDNTPMKDFHDVGEMLLRIFSPDSENATCLEPNSSCITDVLNRPIEVAAGLSLIFVGVLGCIFNWSAAVCICRSPIFRNVFGSICISHLIADIGVVAFCSFWGGPAALLGFDKNLTESIYGQRIGQLTKLFWYASLYSQVQIASNRVLAIVSPVLYNVAFTPRRTKQMIALFWILPVIHAIPYSFGNFILYAVGLK